MYDRNNNPISLTALIFGRHHEAFNSIDFCQILQEKHGFATIVVTSSKHTAIKDLPSLFDFRGVDIDFDFNITSQPYKTNLGKVPLLIPNLKL